MSLSKEETPLSQSSKGGEKRSLLRESVKCCLCNVAYSSSPARTLQCGKCNKHCCCNCMKWNKADFACMKKPGMHFFCPLCEGGAMKSIKVDYDIEEKCKAYFATVEKKIVDIEKKMEKKATKQQVDALESRMEKLEQNLNYQTLEEEVLSLKSEIKNLKSKGVVRVDNESMDGLITERLNDFREQEKRKANVMIYGIKKPDSDEAESAEEIDKTLGYSVF